MTHIHRQVLALWLIIPLSLPSVAFADFSSSGGIPRTGYILVNDPDVAHHLNSFAMIFGHCVWIPPSPKAALAALSLFYGIGISSNPEIGAAETAIASQYVVAGKTQIEAEQEVAWA